MTRQLEKLVKEMTSEVVITIDENRGTIYVFPNEDLYQQLKVNNELNVFPFIRNLGKHLLKQVYRKGQERWLILPFMYNDDLTLEGSLVLSQNRRWLLQIKGYQLSGLNNVPIIQTKHWF